MLRYTSSSESRLPERGCLCSTCRRRWWWEAADLPIFVLIVVGAFIGRYNSWLAGLFLICYAGFRTPELLT